MGHLRVHLAVDLGRALAWRVTSTAALDGPRLKSPGASGSSLADEGTTRLRRDRLKRIAARPPPDRGIGIPTSRSTEEGRSPAPLHVHVPVGICRIAPGGALVDANEALAEMLGYASREELLERHDAELWGDAGAREEWLRAMATKGVLRHHETQALRRDGRPIWIRSSASAARDEEGRILWYDGVVEDVTARKDAERALERRVEFERTLSAVSARLAGSLDLDAAIQDGLGDLARLSGASRAYLFLIRPDGERMDNSHEWCAPGVTRHAPDLQGLPVDAFPWWMARLRNGEAVHVKEVARLPPEASAEREILEPQGIKSALAFPVRSGGTLAGFLGFDNVRRADAWRDEDLHLLHLASGMLGSVLERHRAQAALRISETRFRLLVDQSPFSVQIVAPSGRILRVNPSWERLWGSRLEDLGSYNVLEDPQLVEHGILPYVQRALDGETVLVPPVLYRPHRGAREGQDVWVRAVIYPVKGDDDEVREIVIIQEDITDARRAEAELESSRHQLAVSEKLSALGALVSGVAHEIRTPLTYVSNSAELLERSAERALARGAGVEDLAADVRRHGAAIQEGVGRINELVGDLRGYAKLRGGKRVRADLADVVRGALDLFRATHRGSVQVDARLDPDLPVEVDREQVQQVVLNLLTNAAEAMGGAGVVRVATRAGGPGAELLVEDEGPGLAAEAEAHAFEPFFTTKAEGTGLGLSISKRLVEAHGGSLRHERPEGGVGARFLVGLPLAG